MSLVTNRLTQAIKNDLASINLPPEDSWRPIETAPKTGRWLLLGYYNGCNKWRTVCGQWFSRQQIDDEWEDPDENDEGWYETCDNADDPPNCWPINPTHWMPQPSPPQHSAA